MHLPFRFFRKSQHAGKRVCGEAQFVIVLAGYGDERAIHIEVEPGAADAHDIGGIVVAGDGGAHGDEGRIRTEAQHAAGRVIGVHIDRLGERALRPGFRQPPQRITRFPECEPLQFKRCLVITAPARRRQRCRRISHRRIKFFLRNFHPDSLPVPLSYYSILTVDCKYCGMWGE